MFFEEEVRETSRRGSYPPLATTCLLMKNYPMIVQYYGLMPYNWL